MHDARQRSRARVLALRVLSSIERVAGVLAVVAVVIAARARPADA
jgi:hypothetical protein